MHVRLGAPERLALLEDLGRPRLDLLVPDDRRHVRELAQVERLARPLLVLHHLRQELHLVEVVHELALLRLRVLVLLPYRPDLRPREAAVHPAEQLLRYVVHRLGLAPALLRLRHPVDRRDVAHERLRHVVDQAHLHALEKVEPGREAGRAEHRHKGHSIHVVGYRFTPVKSCVSFRALASK